MRLLLAPAPWAYGSGPAAQCVAVGKEALRRGHEVAFIGNKLTGRLAAEFGLPFVDEFLAPNEGQYPSIPPVLFSDFLAYSGFTSSDFVQETLSGELEILQRVQPDVVFTVWQVTLTLSAEQLGIPVFSSTYFPDHHKFVSPLYPHRIATPGEVELSINRAAEKLGWNRHISMASDLIFRSSAVPVGALPKSFDWGLAEAENELNFVGPLTCDLSGERGAPNAGADLCLIYLPGLGGELVQRVADAVVELGLLPVTCGATCEISGIQTLGTRSFHDFLSEASLCVCHGGLGTVMMALDVGVPLLLFPGDDPERDYVAGCAERLGVAVVNRSSEPVDLRGDIEICMSQATWNAAQAYACRIDVGGAPGRLLDVVDRRLGC